ncbi:MAG: DotU family type IV/VI secretion system protein [Phycisphaeraceae bacterium]|nr:DotU family type IV/VI secretion system protein [Phycisphaeraceae bacterium]
MTLQDLCEPLFQLVCRLNRSARKGVSPEPAAARAEIVETLAKARADSRSDPKLAAQFDAVEIVLIYFCDWMIRSSKLSFASSWTDLALDKGKPGGDEDFFDELDKTLKDPSAEATERLGVFYTCVGLGFAGWYAGQSEYLRKKMQEIHARVRSRSESDRAERICPEAYERVNTADLAEPPGTRIAALVVVVIGLAVTVVAANATLYSQRRGELQETLRGILRISGWTVAATGGEGAK